MLSHVFSVFCCRGPRLFVSAYRFCFAAFCAFFVLQSTALQARPLEEVQDSGQLRVALYQDYAPYSWTEEGKAQGIDVTIAKALAKSLDVELVLLMRLADEGIDDDLRNNVWKGDLIHRQAADVMLHVPVNRQLSARNPLAVITNPYFQESMAVVVDTTVLPEIDTFGPFVTHSIGVELDTASDFFLSGAFNGQLQRSIQRGRTFEDAANLYLDGEVTALMASQAQCEWLASLTAERQSKVFKPPMPGIAMSGWPVGLAVKEDSRDLSYTLGDVLSAMRESGELQAIFAEYGVNYQAPKL